MTAKKPPANDPLDLEVLQALVRDLESQVSALRTQLDAATQEAAKFKDLAARAQADLQNAKARIDRERSELSTFAVESLLRTLLPTIDNFQRAFQHLPSELRDHEWARGVTAIERELLRQLEAVGLKRMSSLGAAANPERHEILRQGPGAKDTVTEVYEEGYELNGRVLRPAKVLVGDGSVLSQKSSPQ